MKARKQQTTLSWLGQIMAAVLLARFIQLWAAPHRTWISSLPQSVAVPRHRITIYYSQHSSWAANVLFLVQPYRGKAGRRPVLAQQPWEAPSFLSSDSSEWGRRHSCCLQLTRLPCSTASVSWGRAFISVVLFVLCRPSWTLFLRWQWKPLTKGVQQTLLFPCRSWYKNWSDKE